MFDKYRRSEAPPAAAAGSARTAHSTPSPSSDAATAVRDNQRTIARSQRELDRERDHLRREEAKLTAEVKRLAAAGQMSAARIAAKSLAANRAQQEKMLGAKYQMGGVSSQMATMKATAAMGKVMGDAGAVMGKMNSATDPNGVLNNVKNYEKQTGKMEMLDEMMNDAMGDALGGEEIDDESEAVLAGVLDEIGMEYKGKMSAVPSSKPQQHEEKVATDADVDALMARLANLA